MTIEICELTPDNASDLDNVVPDVFDHAIDPKSLADFVEDPRHVMYYAKAGDSVVGMVSGVEYFHPDKPAQLWINEIGVAGPYRNRGIGRQLLGALIDYARANDLSSAWLGTDLDNFVAQRCFESHPEAEGPQQFLMYEWELAD